MQNRFAIFQPPNVISLDINNVRKDYPKKRFPSEKLLRISVTFYNSKGTNANSAVPLLVSLISFEPLSLLLNSLPMPEIWRNDAVRGWGAMNTSTDQLPLKILCLIALLSPVLKLTKGPAGPWKSGQGNLFIANKVHSALVNIATKIKLYATLLPLLNKKQTLSNRKGQTENKKTCIHNNLRSSLKYKH